MSLTFSLYVAVLVVVLFTLSRPRFVRYAAQLLLACLCLMIISDLLLAHAQEQSILAGRAIGGLAGGLGTGAVSALVVAAIGTRGRAVTATGNVVGGVMGAAGSQLLVALVATRAPQTVFLGHAIITGALSIPAAAILWLRRQPNRVLLAFTPVTANTIPTEVSQARLFVTGALAWTGISVGVVFGATMFNDLQQPAVQAIGPTLLLVACAAAQLSSPTLARNAPWISGMLAIATGIVGILTGAWLRSDAAALSGFALLGAGTGFASRTALVTLTRGANPARQGAAASLFAAVTYCAAAAVVLVVGLVGNTTGLIRASTATLSVLGVLATVALLWAPRLRDTTHP